MENQGKILELVVGSHSIIEALKNKSRRHTALYVTDKSFAELKKRGKLTEQELKQLQVKLMSPEKLQDTGRKLYQDLGYTYQRIASHMLLLTSATEMRDAFWVMEKIKAVDEIKILCLDNVTDIQNIAAIMRTMAFFGVNILVIAQKKIGIKITPTATRIASGALEYVDLVACSNLSRFIGSLEDRGVLCVGLSEDGTSTAQDAVAKKKKLCLVMGAEDTGLSHAVKRKLTTTIALQANGPISSLNVSVATALAMDKFFNNEI